MNTLGIFNVLHIKDDTLKKYEKSQRDLDVGILIDLMENENVFDTLKYKIKKNIAMVDEFITNEFISHQYQIHSLSKVLIEIMNFNLNKSFIIYEDTFDKVIQEITHNNELKELIKEENGLVVKIKVLEKNKQHLEFDKMINEGIYSESYLNHLFHQMLREFKIPMDKRTEFKSPIFTHKIEVLITNDLLTSNDKNCLKHFLETKNLNFLFLTIKDNFWSNSNF